MQVFNLYLKLAIRNIFRNKKRSLLTLFLIAIGLLSANSLSGLQGGARKQLEEDAKYNLLGDIKISTHGYFLDPIPSNSFQPFGIEEINYLKKLGAKKIISRIKVSSIIMSERKSAALQFVGIDPGSEIEGSFIGESNAIIEGRFLENQEDSGIIIGKRLAKYLGTGLGKRVVVLSQKLDGTSVQRGFKVVGLYQTELQSQEKAYAFTGLKTAQNFLNLKDLISEYSLISENKIDSLPDSYIKISESKQLKFIDWRAAEPFLQAVVKLQDGVLVLWYGIVSFAIFFGVLNTLFIAIHERENEFSLYKALGMSSSGIIIQVVLESIVLVFFGIILGNILTLLVMLILKTTGIPLTAFSDGAALMGLRSTVYPSLSLSKSLIISVLAFFSCTFGSIFPAKRASKVSPIVGLNR